MNKREVDELIQRALKEKDIAPIGCGFYPINPINPINTVTTGTVCQQTLIERAPDTKDLTMLVAQTREKMRREKQIKVTFPVVAADSFIAGHYDAQVYDYSSTLIGSPTNQGIDLSKASIEHKDQLPLLTDEKRVASTHPEPPPAPATQPVPPVQRAPGARLHELAKAVLEPAAYRRYVEPHLADMWLEYNRALNAGNELEARRIVRRGYIEVLKPLLFGLLRTLLRLWMHTRS
jgi:hypothetical protein